MAYVIDDGSVVSASLVGTQFGQQTIFTTHWLYSGPAIADGAAALATLKIQLDQAGSVANLYTNVTPSDLINLEWHLQWIKPSRYRKRVFTSTYDHGLLGTAETPNLACGMSLGTDLANRRGQGTKHIALPGTVFNDGILDQVYRDDVRLLGLGMSGILPGGAGTFTGVLYGRDREEFVKCGKTYPALPWIAEPITSVTVGDTVRVMRRRTVRVGS